MRVANKVALITGAASGMGAATARLLAREGAKVVVADMTHTEHGCFDECTMGPNVRIGGEPQGDDGRVYNGIKTEATCSEVLEKAAGMQRPEQVQ